MQFFDAQTVAQALPFDRLIPALRTLFAQGCEMPSRHVHTLATSDGANMTSLIMPAWIPHRYYGVKIINIAPHNRTRKLPGLHAGYLLHDGDTGVPLAWMEGSTLTNRRTAAASALAASWLARPDAEELLVVGAGQVAALIPAAYASVLPQLKRVRVWARRGEQAQALVRQLHTQQQQSALPIEHIAHIAHIEVADDLPSAVRRADIVSCATLATEPVVQGAWLSAGSHLDLIGSFTPAMREADNAAFAQAGLWVDTLEGFQKSGELMQPMRDGLISPETVRGTLFDLARGQALGRQTANERTVFKSVGIALEDLAAAIEVYQTQAPSE